MILGLFYFSCSHTATNYWQVFEAQVNGDFNVGKGFEAKNGF